MSVKPVSKPTGDVQFDEFLKGYDDFMASHQRASQAFNRAKPVTEHKASKPVTLSSSQQILAWNKQSPAQVQAGLINLDKQLIRDPVRSYETIQQMRTDIGRVRYQLENWPRDPIPFVLPKDTWDAILKAVGEQMKKPAEDAAQITKQDKASNEAYWESFSKALARDS